VKILFNLINLIPNFGIHSLQVAFLASEIAKSLNLDPKKAFLAGYLHDIGVLIPHENFVLDDINASYLINHDIPSGNELTRLHTVIGSFIVNQFEFLRDISEIILKHHALLKFLDEGCGNDIYANILSISEEIAKYHFINDNVDYDDLFFPILSIKSRFFDFIFKATIDILKREFLIWALDDIKHGIINRKMLLDYLLGNDLELKNENLVDEGVLVSFIVDAKSKFTKDHSWRVATVARDMAKTAKLDQDSFFIAGLYHDVGKITTPFKILEKKGKLTDDEIKIMKKHVYYSYIVLNDYKDESWFYPAVRHQERIDGSGYPFKLKENEMSFEDKILQVADYFSALLEDRPYRKGFEKEKAFEITYDTAKKGTLDMQAVEVLNEVLKEDRDYRNISYISKTQKNIDLFVNGLLQ
jgi:putative nucleotidyltransferase with HDIG domain